MCQQIEQCTDNPAIRDARVPGRCDVSEAVGTCGYHEALFFQPLPLFNTSAEEHK